MPLLNDDIQYKFVLLDKHLRDKKLRSIQFPNIIIPPPKIRKEVSFYDDPVKDTTTETNNLDSIIESNISSGIVDDNTYGDENIVYTDVNEAYNYNLALENNYLNNDNIVNNNNNNGNSNNNKPTMSSKTSNVPKLPKIKSGYCLNAINIL